jgi:putative hemolysin
MRAVIEFALLLVLIGVNGLFALSELALISARRARLAVLERKGDPRARLARALADDPQRFLPALQVGMTLVATLTGFLGGARLARHLALWLASYPPLAASAASLADVGVVIGVTYLSLVFGELVPKQLALRHPETAALLAARPVAAWARLGTPVVWVLNRSSSLALRLLGQKGASTPAVTEEELKQFLMEGIKAGVLEPEEHEMLGRLLRLADKPVRAIMTPRTEIAWIDRTDSRRDVILALKSSPHSRFVVCDGSIDNVVGIVQTKELLDRLLDGGDLSLDAVLRQPMVIPDRVSALDALLRLKSDPLGIAVVIDEYGSFEGLVTATDLLEAIVGDLAESHPDLPPPPPSADPEVRELDGLTPIDELKSQLDLPPLPAEGKYHTLGGLLLALLRRVPEVGDRIVFGGWRFEVMAMDGRRVARVRVSREPAVVG